MEVDTAVKKILSLQSWEDIEKLTSEWSESFKKQVWGKLTTEEKAQIRRIKQNNRIKCGDFVSFVNPVTLADCKGKVIEYKEEKTIFVRAVVETFNFGKISRFVICRKDWINK